VNHTKNFNIFVVTDNVRHRLSEPSAMEIAEECLKRNIWAVGGYRKNYLLKENDFVIIYIAGTRENNKKFVATAEISKEPIVKKTEIVNKVWDVRISLKNIKYFKSPICIMPLLNELSFIKNKEFWGASLMKAVVKINSEDYQKILAYKNLELEVQCKNCNIVTNCKSRNVIKKIK